MTEISRRNVLKTCLGTSFWLTTGLWKAHGESAATKVEQAHAEIWRRFIDEYDILIDYADLDGKYPRPTPEECMEGKPNALAWWTPTENGSMFNGLYMDAMCTRWKFSGNEADRTKARRLMNGLLKLGSLGTPGFIARNVATDGKTPYPMGSNDQTMPWFYGLWRYVHDGMASEEEKAKIIAKMRDVAEVLAGNGWLMPCNDGAPSKFRGGFKSVRWEDAPRLLFLLKAMHHLTGEEKWAELYHKLGQEKDEKMGITRLDVCATGMVFQEKSRHSWTCAGGVACLRAMWEMETDTVLRDVYAKGLAASVMLAAEGLPLAQKFDNNTQAAFLSDWRVLNQWWQPQHSEADAVAVANAEAKQLGPLSPRRYQEFTWVREPVFAAWIVTLCPERTVVTPHREAIEATLAHYDYSRLFYSQFFPAEAAWNRLQLLDRS